MSATTITPHIHIREYRYEGEDVDMRAFYTCCGEWARGVVCDHPDWIAADKARMTSPEMVADMARWVAAIRKRGIKFNRPACRSYTISRPRGGYVGRHGR